MEEPAAVPAAAEPAAPAAAAEASKPTPAPRDRSSISIDEAAIHAAGPHFGPPTDEIPRPNFKAPENALPEEGWRDSGGARATTQPDLNSVRLGKFTLPDGSIYHGTLRKGQPDGLGKCVFANGHIYDGEWANGVMHGFGSYLWPSGQRYHGEWTVRGAAAEHAHTHTHTHTYTMHTHTHALTSPHVHHT
jgi:hypothetical protein